MFARVVVRLSDAQYQEIDYGNRHKNTAMSIYRGIFGDCKSWVSSFVRHYYIGWWRGTAVERRSLAGKLSVARSTFSRWVTTYVGKLSAGGQPTRSTQRFIYFGSINEK